MSTPINTGGPAYPLNDGAAIHVFAQSAVEGITEPDARDRAYMAARANANGMTLRDHFAGLAMQGELAAISDPEDKAFGLPMSMNDDNLSRLAVHWYRIADAMLAARGH